MKMTKAFIENIYDDFICGLSADTHSFDDPDDLLDNKDELIKYTKQMLYLHKGIMMDSPDPISVYPKIRCYESFLKKIEGK